MASKDDQSPIFLLTHPRARATAFLRMMMSRPEIACMHEPFAEAFFFGPERLSAWYEDDLNEEQRLASGLSGSTYHTVMEKIKKEGSQGKRLFIKDMAKHFMKPFAVSIAPSLQQGHKRKLDDANYASSSHLETKGHVPSERTLIENSSPFSGLKAASGSSHGIGISEKSNPTVVPLSLLQQFRFVFLIRSPEETVASYYRLTRSPQWTTNGMHEFKPCDVSYKELRTLFDYFYSIDKKGIARKATGHSLLGSLKANICVIDSDVLVDQPAEVMQKFCDHMNVQYTPDMLWFGGMDGEGHAAKALRRRCNALQEMAMESKKLASRDLAEEPEYKEYDPEEFMEQYCQLLNVKFTPDMVDHLCEFGGVPKKKAENANLIRGCRNLLQEVWMKDRNLMPLDDGEKPTDAEYFLWWALEFGVEAAVTITETVKAMRPDYEYLKSFAMNVDTETSTQRVLRVAGPPGAHPDDPVPAKAHICRSLR